MKKFFIVLTVFLAFILPCNANNLCNQDYFKNGCTNLSKGNYEQASNDFTSEIALNQKNSRAYCNRAICKYKLNNKKGSFIDFQKAIKLNSQDTVVYFSNLLDSNGIKDYCQTIQKYSHKNSKQSAQEYCSEGLKKLNANNYNDAIKDFSKAIKLNKNCAKAYYFKGDALISINDKKNALRYLKKSLKIYARQNSIKNTEIVQRKINDLRNNNNLVQSKDSKDNKKIDLNPYIEYIQHSVKQNWDCPKPTTSKRVIALFRIDKKGNLLSLKIIQSSGDKQVDDAAIEAIKKTAPFKPLPEDFPNNTTLIQFTFDYNIFK